MSWFLNPTPPNPDREEYERKLRDRQIRHLESLRKRTNLPSWRPCAHDDCQKCHGTGITMHGPCVHSLVCYCPKCSPYSMSSTALAIGDSHVR